MSDFRIKVNVELDTKDLKSQLEGLNENIELKLDTNKISSQLKELKGSMKDVFNIEIKNLKDLTSAVKSIEKLNRVINNTGKIDNQMKDMVNQYKDLANVYSKLEKQMNSGSLGENSLKRSALQLSELKTQMSQLYDKMDANAKAKIDLFNTKQSIKDISDMNNYLNKIESTATSLGTKLNSISFDHIDSSKIEKIQNELKEILDLAKQDIDLELNVGDILSDLDKISNEIKNLEKIENLASSFEKVSSSVTDTKGNIEKLSSEIKSLENVADNLDGSFDKAFKGASDSVKDFQNNLKKLNSSSKSGSGIFGDKDDFLGNFTQFKILDLAGEFIADGARQLASAWKDTIVETDTAITDLNKVLTNRLTGDALDGYLNQVTQVAKGTGQASTDIIQGTAKAVQSGIKDTEQALKYAQQSAIFANIGDMSQEEADKILTSVMSANGGVEKSLQQTSSHLKAYGKDYSQLQEFIDMANFAGNNFAVTTKDVGTALQLSSSALSANGVSMEKQIAMSVAMNEVMQDASKTGNSLKSISANMSGVIFSLKEGDVQANKSAKALEKLTGIKLFDETTGNVMDMYEAMDKLSGKWDDLTEAEKSTIAQTIAGKQNLTSFFALMDNWETAQQYVADYNDGLKMAGNATKENEQYLDSVQGKWNSIKEDLKATGLNIIDSEMAKDGLDFISSITSVLPKASEKANEFYKAFYGGNFDNEVSDFIYESFEKIDLTDKLKGLSSQISSFFSNTFNKDNGFVKAISGMFDSLSKNDFISKGLTDLSTAYGKYIDAITNFGGAGFFKGLGKVLNSESKELEKSIDGHKNRIGILQEEIGSMTTQKEKLNSISEEYEKLSKNTKRSATEEEKYLNLKNEIASVNPDLVLGYDSSGSPILKDLKLQNEQYDRQIKLKQQSLRLEENSLATDTQKQRLQNLEDYNKALEDYNNSQLYSDTKRKEGFFTDESLQDYAKRLKESNAKVEKANLESYSKRLEDHQKYLDDERAIQEKYINQMESSNSFEKMSESARQNMLTFMDTLNWSEFSDTQASAFTRQLGEISDKIVSTTDQMGEYGKKITEVSDAYANHESNMIGYTKALGDIYEASGKLDNQSLMQWFDSLKEYGSLTGDLNGVNACINEMATSLEKVTGIDASTWKTAFEFDPVPIDASSKALQNFLKSYNTGVQNLGKGGLADKLKSQFETLQSSYLQLTEDVANGGEIDIEYLANIKINQPEPIQNLIDEIISDDEVTEQEIELLMTVMPEILNTGEISEETYQLIADTLEMDVQEVKAKFNINAEVDGNFEEVQKHVEQWNTIENLKDKALELTTKVKDFNLVEKVKEIWEGLKDKAIELKAKIKDFNLMEELGNLKEGAIELAVKIIGQENIEKIQEAWGDFKNSVVELTVKIIGQDNIDKLQEAWGNFKENLSELKAKIEVEGQEKIEKIQELWNTFKENFNEIRAKVEVEGQEKIEKIQETWNTFKENLNEIKINIQNTELVQNLLEDLETLKEFKDGVIELAIEVKDDYLTTISEALESFKDKTVELAIEVKDEYLTSVKEKWESIRDKGVNLICAVLNGDLVEYLKEDWENLKDKAINLVANVTGSNLVENLKNLWEDIKSKGETLTANVMGSDLVSNLKGIWDNIKSKSETLTAMVTGTNLVQALKGLWDGIKSKLETLTANTSGTNLVQTLKSAWEAIKTKSVSLTASVTGSGLVTSLKSAWDAIKSKTVTLTAKISQVGSSIISGIGNLFGGKKSIDVPIQANPTVATSRKVQPINTTNLSNIPISASDTPTSTDTSLANIGVSAKAFNASSILSDLQYSIEPYIELEQALDRIAKQFDIIEEKSERALGQSRIELLQQQIPLLQQQQQIQRRIVEEEKAQLNTLKSALQGQGFLINANNELLNYEEKLLAMERNVEKLKRTYEDANKFASDTDSKDEALKKSREQQAESLKNQYDNANESLSLTKKYLDEFIDSSNQLADANKSWEEYETEIKKVRDEIEKANRELRLFASTNRLTQLNYEIEKVGNSLDILDNKIDSASGVEKINLLTKSIGILNNELGLQGQKMNVIKEQMRAYQVDLKKYGFKFNGNDEITNFESGMNNFRDSSDLEKIVELTEEYFDLQSELGKLTVDYDNLQKEISDVKGEIKEINEELEEERLERLRDDLEATKDVEEELTSIYEKEYKKRKEQLEDYMDTRIKMLEDEKNAYKEIRDAQEYEKGLQDQTDEIEELRRKLEIAKRDTSLQGLKRQKEIAEDLAKAEEDLAKYTQDKIDEDYEKNIDNEIEKIEQEKESLLGALEEQFSEVNIAKMVQSALTSGFVEINGEIKSIQEILIESINNSANAYSVLGATVKQELVDNLNIALDTMKELESIYKDLNVSDYGIITSDISPSIPNNNYSTNTKNITIGDTNITISGTVSDNILDDIEELIEQKNREMLKSISKGL